MKGYHTKSINYWHGLCEFFFIILTLQREILYFLHHCIYLTAVVTLQIQILKPIVTSPCISDTLHLLPFSTCPPDGLRLFHLSQSPDSHLLTCVSFPNQPFSPVNARLLVFISCAQPSNHLFLFTCLWPAHLLRPCWVCFTVKASIPFINLLALWAFVCISVLRPLLPEFTNCHTHDDYN